MIVFRRARLFIAFVLLASPAFAVAQEALPAPRIRVVGLRSPARARAGELLVVAAHPLAAADAVRFAGPDGAPLVVTPQYLDADRGLLAVRVPDGAATGALQVGADGRLSDGFRLVIEPGAAPPATGTVVGQLTSGGRPVAGQPVVLVRNDGCGWIELRDLALTDADGRYTLRGGSGTHYVVAGPLTGSALPTAYATVALGALPVTANLALGAATLVRGSVVGPGAVPVAGVRVAMWGPSVEQVVTGADGAFAARLPAGSWSFGFDPPAGAGLVHRTAAVTVIAGTEQLLAPHVLAGGSVVRGRVVRADDGSPVAGALAVARTAGTCCGWRDLTATDGDGRYELVVAAGAAHDLAFEFDRAADLADGLVRAVVAGPEGLVQDVIAVPAAALSGRVRHAVSGAGLAVDVVARPAAGEGPAHRGRSCADGTYRLRVVPGLAGGYTVHAATDGSTGYAAQSWNGTPEGTWFACEALAVAPAAAGDDVAGLDFRLPQALVLAGAVRTQASGCTAAQPGAVVVVDDGRDHACGLGLADTRAAAGTWSVRALPPSSVLPGLRACTAPAGVVPQCFDLQRPPAYDALVGGPGMTLAGVDFCVGTVPGTPLLGLALAREGSDLVLDWPPSSDPYHDHFVVYGSRAVAPRSTDEFEVLGTTDGTRWTVPLDAPFASFEVRDAGPAGELDPPGDTP